MKKSVAWVVILLLLSTSAYANVCTWAESKSWSVSAPCKLTRGILNLGLGWTNLLVQPFKGDGVMNGIGLGLSNFTTRTIQGLGEILLFWLPPAPEEPLTECVFYDWGLMQKP